MKKSNSNKNFNYTLKALSSFLTNINSIYSKSHIKSFALYKALFISYLVESFLKQREIIALADESYKKELYKTLANSYYINQCFTVLKKNELYSAKADLFQSNCFQLVSLLTSQETFERNGLEGITNLSNILLRQLQTLFIERVNERQTIDYIQAISIALNANELNIEQRLQLVDKLLLVKELWQLDHRQFMALECSKLPSRVNIAKIVSSLSFVDACEAASNIISILIEDKQNLVSLSDIKLLRLYNRLKESEIESKALLKLMGAIHQESRLRYGYNKLTEVSHEILKHFQSLDTISHKIENSEFLIAESFLLRPDTFLQETTIALAKHIDYIMLVKGYDLVALDRILKKIDAALRCKVMKDQSNSLGTLSSIESKLANGLNNQTLRRYSELDQFSVYSLKKRYSSLLNNIEKLLDEDNEDTYFLEKTITKKLANDYTIINYAVTSKQDPRTTAAELATIEQQLSEIDFISIFSPEHTNTICSLNFRRQMTNVNISSKEEYVHSIIQILAGNCHASQLATLYHSLPNASLTQTQSILKHELLAQIHQRTSIKKIIYSLFTGRAKDIKKLKLIKKFAAAKTAKVIDKIDKLDFANMVSPAEIKYKVRGIDE